LLGIQALSLVVQIAGMAEIASRPILSAIWWILIVLGAATLAFRARTWPAISFSRCEVGKHIPLGGLAYLRPRIPRIDPLHIVPLVQFIP
jgi:hypothetical protein